MIDKKKAIRLTQLFGVFLSSFVIFLGAYVMTIVPFYFGYITVFCGQLEMIVWTYRYWKELD